MYFGCNVTYGYDKDINNNWGVSLECAAQHEELLSQCRRDEHLSKLLQSDGFLVWQ